MLHNEYDEDGMEEEIATSNISSSNNGVRKEGGGQHFAPMECDISPIPRFPGCSSNTQQQRPSDPPALAAVMNSSPLDSQHQHRHQQLRSGEGQSASADVEITTFSINSPSTIRFQSSEEFASGEGEMVEEADAEDDALVAEGAIYIIVEPNLKFFNTAINTLSRFSEHLHFEPTPQPLNGLSLKALTASQSAFAHIHFNAGFFAAVDVSRINPEEYNICRVSMRCALATFNLAHCRSAMPPLAYRLAIDPGADVMVVRTRYAHSIYKCSVINLRECAATYRHLFSDKTQLANKLRAQASVLLSVLTNVGTDSDEVKLCATPEHLVLERFVRNSNLQHHQHSREQAQLRTFARRTHAVVDLDTLELYAVPKPAEVVMRLKELRAILHLADEAGLSVDIHFDSPGRPVIVALEENLDLEAEFTLGTFPRASIQPAQQPQPTTSSPLSPREAASSDNTPAALPLTPPLQGIEHLAIATTSTAPRNPMTLLSEMVENEVGVERMEIGGRCGGGESYFYDGRQRLLDDEVEEGVLTPIENTNSTTSYSQRESSNSGGGMDNDGMGGRKESAATPPANAHDNGYNTSSLNDSFYEDDY